MKKISIILLNAIFISTVFVDCLTASLKKSRTHVGAKNSTGGISSKTVNSTGQTIRGRSSSNSKTTGHAATMQGAHGTITSTNTGAGTGQHVVENTADTKSATITNKEILKRRRSSGQDSTQGSNHQIPASVKRRLIESKKSDHANISSDSRGGSSNIGMTTKLFAKKSASKDGKAAMMNSVMVEGMAAKQAQSAEQNSSSGGSGSGSTSSLEQAQNNLFNADVQSMQGTTQVSSNSAPQSAKPVIPSPIASTTPSSVTTPTTSSPAAPAA